ncbi:hypothetical protein EJB05_30456, partial [Eragrostis curvula]
MARGGWSPLSPTGGSAGDRDIEKLNICSLYTTRIPCNFTACASQVQDQRRGDLLREGNLEESALVDVWLDVEAHQYTPAISPIVYQLFLVPMQGGTPDQKLIDECLEKMKKVLDVYEARLSKFKYLSGDFVSLADLSHFPYTLPFMATPYASVFDSYPSVKAWWESLMSRPAVQRVVSQPPQN